MWIIIVELDPSTTIEFNLTQPKYIQRSKYRTSSMQKWPHWYQINFRKADITINSTEVIYPVAFITTRAPRVSFVM